METYSSLEPWGDTRADIRAALNTSVVAASTSMSGEAPNVEPLANYAQEFLTSTANKATAASPNAAAAAMRARYPGSVR